MSRKPLARIAPLLLGLTGSACTPDSDLTGITGITDSSPFDGDSEDTGSDASTSDSTGDTGGMCLNQTQACADLLLCLAVVLPDADVSSIEEGGSCWCGTPQEAQACAEHCVDQLELVEQKYPTVEACAGEGSDDDDPMPGDGDGDPDPDPRPNLTLYQFFLDSHELAPGDTVDYYYELVNEGPVDTQYIYQDRLILSLNDVLGDDDDIVIYEVAWDYIVEANQNYLYYAPVTLPDDLPDGEYFVAMELDYTNVIEESDETDNWLFDADTLFLQGPEPIAIDLAPSGVVASESAVTVGASTDVEVTINNLGPSDAGAYSVRFYYSSDHDITVNDVLLCTVNEAGLAANSATVVQDQCVVPELDGDHYLGVIVDPGNLIAETNEDNNSAFNPALISIAPLQVDLEPSAVSSGSHAVDSGDVTNFSATVTNHGLDPSPAFSLAFYYSSDANINAADTLICQANGPALQPGASAPLDKNCAVPSLATGDYRLGVIVDPSNAIGETNEANNTALDPSAVTITAPDVDLEYDWHTDDLPYFADPGQQLTYMLDVWNHGSDASPSFEATMLWSLDANISLFDIEGCTIELPSIPSQTKFHYEFICSVPNLPLGAYYSGVVIDPSNEVPESNEFNNVGVSFDTQQFQ